MIGDDGLHEHQREAIEIIRQNPHARVIILDGHGSVSLGGHSIGKLLRVAIASEAITLIAACDKLNDVHIRRNSKGEARFHLLPPLELPPLRLFKCKAERREDRERRAMFYSAPEPFNAPRPRNARIAGLDIRRFIPRRMA